MDLPERNEAKSWEGSTVVDRDGEVLGPCTGIFADTDTGVTEWLAIDVQGHRNSFVPALGATESEGTVRVPFVRGTVLSAPRVGDEVQLSKSDEVLLYRHYDVAHTSTESGSVLPAGPGALGSQETATVVTPAPSLPPLSGSPLPSSATTVGAPPTAADGDDGLAPLGSAPLEPELEPEPEPEPEPVPATTGMTTGTATAPTPPDEPTIEPVAVVTPAPEPVAVSAPEPRPVPVPTPASTAASSSGAGPLAVVAGVVAAAALALKAWERRAERRRSPKARAARLSRTVKTGSALAARSASKQLAEGATAASRTSRQATRTTKALASAGADSASRTGRTATRKTRQLASTGSDSASRASRRASRRTRALAASGTGTASAASRRTSKKASRSSRKLARTTATTKKEVSSSVSALPKTVAKKGRRARRSVVGNLWDLAVLSGTGAGYVLGARAGRERYEQINQQASELVASPQVQALTRAVADPARRQQVIAPVKRSTSALTERLQGPRT